MNEELLNEYQFLQLNQTRQSELIAQHCAGVEENIRLSASLSEAENIVKAVCEKFDGECSSSIIRSVLVQHLHNIVKRYWQKE
jgi:hypothetical protein